MEGSREKVRCVCTIVQCFIYCRFKVTLYQICTKVRLDYAFHIYMFRCVFCVQTNNTAKNVLLIMIYSASYIIM